MPIPLRPGESPLYPSPYLETEAHLLVITNQRVVHFGDEGRQELAASAIQFVGRRARRPWWGVGLLLLLGGFALLGCGLLRADELGLLPLHALSSGATPGDDPSIPVPEEEPPEESEEGNAWWTARHSTFALLGGGALIVAAAVLLFRRRQFHVIVQGGPTVIRMRAASDEEQTQLVALLGAIRSSNKAAPDVPAIEIDDGGDPVRALQELAEERKRGRVGVAEYDARRAALLERVRARRET